MITLAMNLFSQGVDPKLDMTDIDHLRRVTEYCNRLPVHLRHPYVGDLVYTSFSGSHQDAIKKGFAALGRTTRSWGVPYLPIDPKHVGRTYEAVIRVNSQSGKGGVAYIMKEEHGLDLPRRLQIEFSKTIQTITEDTGTVIEPADMWATFQRVPARRRRRLQLLSHETTTSDKGASVTAQLLVDGEHHTVTGGQRPDRRLRRRPPGRPRHRHRRRRLQRARRRRRQRRHRRRLRRDHPRGRHREVGRRACTRASSRRRCAPSCPPSTATAPTRHSSSATSLTA